MSEVNGGGYFIIGLLIGSSAGALFGWLAIPAIPVLFIGAAVVESFYDFFHHNELNWVAKVLKGIDDMGHSRAVIAFIRAGEVVFRRPKENRFKKVGGDSGGRR